MMQFSAPAPAPALALALYDVQEDEIPDMECSVRMVEDILKYRFVNKKLLEEALTHPSYTGSPSYQRLEFIGDAALGLAFTNFVFLHYPGVDPGKLSLIRAANISTEKLARVAVRHQLYKYVRHNVVSLDEKLRDFVMVVQEEDDAEIYGGLVKAPKVLADLVEALSAAVYVDSKFDLNVMWEIIRDLLEPMAMLDALTHQPQPVTLLFEVCQKDGKQIQIRYWKKEENIVASVYVDGELVTSASSEQKENAKLHAAKAALRKLCYDSGDLMHDIFAKLNEDGEIEGAKQKLHELCGKKKWPKPNYKIVDEFGRAHDKRYICSVGIKITEDVLTVTGKEKPRVKEAENSAASLLLFSLKDHLIF